MSITSDVGVAIKQELWERLSDKSKRFLIETADWMLDNSGDKLCIFESIKWYLENNDIISLYQNLNELDEMGSSYLIVEACPEYPSASDSDRGAWNENPWRLTKVVSVSLQWF